MRNIRLLIEYDGKNYSGWQAQTGLMTIQGVIAAAVKKLTGEGAKIIGASRTDAKVHALGQVANFVTSSGIPLKGIMYGLNFILPDDIVIKKVEEVPLEFDSRHDAKAKTYIYRVFNENHRSALFRDYVWHVGYVLDIEVMQKGADEFVGKKDFSSFKSARCDSLHSIREIISFKVQRKEEKIIEFEVKGTAFLRHMVRIMVGALVTLGRGKISVDDVRAIIEARDRTKAPRAAPAGGLMLKKSIRPILFGWVPGCLCCSLLRRR